jgi:regulator of nucleoside diphosphate kinase
MPYDPLPVTIAADDAEALAVLLHEVSSKLRPATPTTEYLSEMLYGARIETTGDMPADVVRLGAGATYTELASGVKRTVRVVTPSQADASAGRVSVLSPIGCALIGRRAGAVVEVALPAASIAVRLDAVDHAMAGEPTAASA